MPIVGYMIPLLNDAAEERRMQSCNAQKLAREQKKLVQASKDEGPIHLTLSFKL